MKAPRKHLYRYYSNADFILDVLRYRRLYHCLPMEFNDPFDCRPLLTIRHSKCNNGTWHKLFFHLAKFQYPEETTEELTKHADAAMAKGLHKDTAWLSEVDETFKTIGSLVRVCCFATDARNMMMWTHYAANHQGLALVFRTAFLLDDQSKEFRGQAVTYVPSALGVHEYVDAIEKDSTNEDSAAMARIIYSTKTKHWRGEEEIRFFTSKERTHLSFPESALCAIVFGDRCWEHLIGHVIEALKDWDHKPRLFKASITKATHKLWIGRHQLSPHPVANQAHDDSRLPLINDKQNMKQE